MDHNRIARLSQPRHRPYPEEGDINKVSPATLKYVATERVLSLAQPRQEKLDDVVYEIPRISFPINPDYASVKSHGLDKLAQPLHPRAKHVKGAVDDRCSYSPVSRGALQCETSALTKKLARPKEIEEEEASDPYKVKKKALIKLQKKQESVFVKMSTPIEWKVTPKFESKTVKSS